MTLRLCQVLLIVIVHLHFWCWHIHYCFIFQGAVLIKNLAAKEPSALGLDTYYKQYYLCLAAAAATIKWYFSDYKLLWEPYFRILGFCFLILFIKLPPAIIISEYTIICQWIPNSICKITNSMTTKVNFGVECINIARKYKDDKSKLNFLQ